MSYTEYDSIVIKLRIDDDSMRDEIELYMQEIDDLIDNRLGAKLGKRNVYGKAIVLPLDFDTIPPIPLELKAIANDLVVAKIRLQNSEKPLLWDSAVKVLDNYLDRVYGWTKATPFQPTRTIGVSPVSGTAPQTLTITGTNFEPNAVLTVVFGSTNPTTTPAEAITTSTGTFSFTFDVEAGTTTGEYKIKVSDNFGGLEDKFQVTV